MRGNEKGKSTLQLKEKDQFSAQMVAEEAMGNLSHHQERGKPQELHSQVSPSPIQPVLEHFHGWDSHRFSGNLCQGLTTLTKKHFFS